tara:strand:+ start:345 stop:638 length:294 start_codon:yes stop_codon:yes gene_type:complete
VIELTRKHTEEAAKRWFEFFDGDKYVARMTSSRVVPNNLFIDYTALDPAVRGMGSGTKIVDYIVHWSRENQHKIMPLCPFTEIALEKHPEWHDIIRK